MPQPTLRQSSSQSTDFSSSSSDLTNNSEAIELDQLENVQDIFDQLHENEKDQATLLEQKKLIDEKITRNNLQQKQKKWFNRDAKAGTLAGAAIVALYSGVEKVGNFLPPGTANLIMPFFIVADILTTVAAWKQALLSRKLNAEKNKEAGLSSWKGSRNQLLRAIFETAWATLGTATVLGAIITSTFLATAAATAFAIVIAPFFMVVLGTRTIFNAISSAFHVIRAHRTESKAKNEPDQTKKDELLAKANGYRHVAKIQAAAAGASAIGFIATTVVMLTHHFSFAFIGVGGGLALGGLMAYLFHGNSKYSSALKKDRLSMDKEITSVESKLDTLESAHKQKSSSLLSRLGDHAKALGKFVLPVSVPADSTEPSKPTKQKLTSSNNVIKLKISEAPDQAKNPGMKIVKVKSGERVIELPVDSNHNPIAKTRFGLYAPRITEATEQVQERSVKKRK